MHIGGQLKRVAREREGSGNGEGYGRRKKSTYFYGVLCYGGGGEPPLANFLLKTGNFCFGFQSIQ